MLPSPQCSIAKPVCYLAKELIDFAVFCAAFLRKQVLLPVLGKAGNADSKQAEFRTRVGIQPVAEQPTGDQLEFAAAAGRRMEAFLPTQGREIR